MKLNKKVASFSSHFGLTLVALVGIAILMLVNGQISSIF